MIGRDPDTLAIGGVIVGILGAVPAFFVARTAQRPRSLIAGLAGDRGEILACHLSHWNDSFFRSKGIVIRLDLLGGHWNHLEGTRPHAMTPSSCSDRSGSETTAHTTARVVVIPLNT